MPIFQTDQAILICYSSTDRPMDLAPLIDHTLLSPDAKTTDIERICREAEQYGFCAVCIPPYHVKEAWQLLRESQVLVATVVGFPMGYSRTSAKVEEIKKAIDEGADELDVVVNRCALKSGDWSYVRSDLESMTVAAQYKGKLIKAILETSQLADAELEKLCQICNEIGVDFVKTSTGLSREGATLEAVRKMASWVKPSIKIKASGGIRTREQALSLVEAGAARIGTSRGVALLNGQ